MQFAVIHAREGSNPRLVSGLEYALVTQQPAVKDEEPDETALRWKVAYGRFFPNPDEDAADAARQIAELNGSAFGCFFPGPVCRWSEMRDIEFIGEPIAGRPGGFAIAVLLGTLEEIPRRGQALCFFPRYTNLDPLTNIVNRPGILAIRGLAHDGAEPPEDWRKLIDRRRAARIAASIA